MSDIPKSERSESPLRSQHMIYNIRKRITAELMATFGYSEKRFEKHLKAVTAYAADDERLLDARRIDYEDIENSFKSWMGGNWKRMSRQQIGSMSLLYYQLFKRRIT